MVSIGSGVPGIEVEHEFHMPDGAVAHLGQRDTPRAHVKLLEINGLHGRGEVESALRARGRGPGSYVGRVSVPKKVVTYEGVVRAKSLDEMRVIQFALDRTFYDPSAVGIMRIKGIVPWYFTAVAYSYECADVQEHGPRHVYPWQRKLEVAFELPDPRVYVDGAQPQQNRSSAGTVVCDNQGSAATDPTIDVQHSGGTLRVSNQTKGTDLWFDGLPAGTYSLNFFARTITRAGEEWSGYLRHSSTWWDFGTIGLAPGLNTIYGSGPFTVYWRHASG